MITHIVERKTRNHICGMAGKCASRGVDQQESFSPASHTRFRITRVIVWDDRVDPRAAGKSLLRGSDYLRCMSHLLTRWHEQSAVTQRPSVILCVCDLYAIALQSFCKCDDFFQMVQILPVHYDVHCESDPMRAN